MQGRPHYGRGTPHAKGLCCAEVGRIVVHTGKLSGFDPFGLNVFPETESESLIPLADVVAITGTALTNHTLEHLLSLCSPGAYVVMLGDTVPLCPVLFYYGVDAICDT